MTPVVLHKFQFRFYLFLIKTQCFCNMFFYRKNLHAISCTVLYCFY